MLHQNKVNMAGLIEIRVKEKNMKTVLKGIVPGWKMVNNYNVSPNGRIWLVWDDNWYGLR